MDIRRIYVRLPQLIKELLANIEAEKRDSFRRSDLYNSLYDSVSFHDLIYNDSETEVMKSITDLLQYARNHIPAYKGIQATTLTDFPILEKKDYRINYSDYISDETDRSDLVEAKTSGSSGSPLTFYTHKESYNYNYVYNDKYLEFIGCDLKANRARFSGVLTSRTGKTTPPYWVYVSRYKQLQLSTYHITKDSAKDYVEAMRKYKVQFGTGYPSAWISLAQCIINSAIDAPHLKTIVTDSEGISIEQKQLLSKTFGCEVYATYGTSETGNIAVQCRYGNYHVIPKMAYVETVDEKDNPCTGEGDILITNLTSKYTPQIRYRIGDRGLLGNGICPCGMHTQYFTSITGRIEDYVLVDGKRITRLSAPFQTAKHILSAQIIQENDGSLHILIIPDKGFEDEDMKDVISRIRLLIGDKPIIRWQTTQALERTANGKVKFIIRK